MCGTKILTRPVHGVVIDAVDVSEGVGGTSLELRVEVRITPSARLQVVTHGRNHVIGHVQSGLDSVTVDGQPAVLTNGGYTFSALNDNHSISVV